MLSDQLAARLKKSFFGRYTLTKKHLKEILQALEIEGKQQQTLSIENSRLKSEVEKAGMLKQSLEGEIVSLNNRLNDSSHVLSEERKLTAKQKANCDELSEKIRALEIELAQESGRAEVVENEMKAKQQNLQQRLEELSSEHHLQLQKQKQDFEQTRERILKEKEEIEAEKSDLLQDLNLAYDAQVMTEKRRRQMENELATCQVALEKESNEKAELEQKITSLCESKEAEIQELLKQLKTAKEQETHSIKNLEQYRDHIKKLHAQIWNALST